MSITDRLLDLDRTLEIHEEGHWNIPYSHMPGEFTSFNDAGLECETGELLYSFVRMLKPRWVLETGTHWGVGASYMGMALKDNGKGQLDTIEFLPEIHTRACERIYGAMKLDGIVRCHLGDVAKFDPYQNSVGFGGSQYGIILLDTEPQIRFAELIKFFPYLLPGGFVFIHDLHRHMAQVGQNPDHPNEPLWPWGPLPQQIKDWVKDGQLRPFHFSTPRGLTGFYKPSRGDYQWL